MAKFSISMTDRMAQTVQRRVEAGDYNNVSEYFRDLVRRDEENSERHAALKDAIEKGLNSGISPRTPQDIMADIKEKLKADARI
ncbi:MAG: type II toxin-antitoxin system ParD family antitoxin [Asticcacaulis sp.]